MVQPQTPQQRKANNLYAKKEAAKRGKQSASEEKAAVTRRSIVQKITIGNQSDFENPSIDGGRNYRYSDFRECVI